ncbi:GNAT family N-acetyltransferase [Rhizobium sp. BK176]|uniref:GNAT family N-acetyltransferase n=1 Tax=Rhizobium sp. BK176 TaxID=2587071 RepID=UPI0021686CB2|nr:GNAT family protein [Rhizobium sp. BK176]MCS4090154.1 RimJ/RimL family protein N-acetyltransferase [Rhizobium sp. BK176]
MNLNAILSDDYAAILDVAQVGPYFGVNGREDYHFFFDELLVAEDIVWEDGDYAIADVHYDTPTVMLFHQGSVVGFYYDMMAWLDPEHRGNGLATKMIFAFADHFGDDAFKEARIKADCAMGFSQEGYDLHVRALEMARELSRTQAPNRTPAP